MDNDNIRGTLTGSLSGVAFDPNYTAEDIKSYNPDHLDFHYLLDRIKLEFGLDSSDVLHAVKSLMADHVPVKGIGLTTVWIARGDEGVSAMGGNWRL